GETVLEDHVRGAIDDPERGAVGHEVLGITVATVAVDGEAETAGRVLAAGQPAGGAGVLVDLVGGAIHQPDVGAVGGDAGERRGGAQAAGRPGAELYAVVVVDVDILVRVHDPDRGPRRGGRHAARRGVGAELRDGDLLGRAPAAVFVGLDGAAIDHEELGLLVEDAAGALGAADRGTRRAREIHGECPGRPSRGDGGDGHIDRLRGDTRWEDQRAG